MPKPACDVLEYQNRQFNGWSTTGKPLAQCTLYDKVSFYFKKQNHFPRLSNQFAVAAAIDQMVARCFPVMKQTLLG